MIKIRLLPTGKKHHRTFRIVAAESAWKRNGKILETLGFYLPKTKPPTVKFKKERLNYWLTHGAKATATVSRLVKNGKTTRKSR